MTKNVSAVTFFVDDYDNSINYFTEVLGFTLTEDKTNGEDNRFVLVTPKGGNTSLLLAKAKSDEEKLLVGRQAAGKVFLILNTDDFWRDHKQFTAKGVKFLETPREEVYGIVAIFEDCYGNKWDLIQNA
ncbi:VOC family protein [Alteromonas gracilis]|uniref:VOC family protein n=1 Tax=Alteromonas gracilis TaxID=1479524 RepID=UPI0030CB8035